MPTNDTCVTIAPYFRVKSGKMTEFKALTARFVAASHTEPGCHYYGFAYDGDLAFCREGYRNAGAALTHVEHVGAMIQEALQISNLERLEVVGSETELAHLRGPMAALNPVFFVLDVGFGVRI
jgi:quinol monooxygenase YgiN